MSVRNGFSISIVLIALGPVLAGCNQTSSTATLPLLQTGESSLPFCLAARPISYSTARDTPETRAQIKEHNAVGTELGCKRWK